MKTIEKLLLVRNLVDDLIKWDMEGLDVISIDLLKVFENSLGIRHMAEMITPHPNQGYFIRYADDMTRKLVTALYEKHINENEIILKELLIK